MGTAARASVAGKFSSGSWNVGFQTQSPHICKSVLPEGNFPLLVEMKTAAFRLETVPFLPLAEHGLWGHL